MTSLVNKSDDWTLNYHKILILSPPKSLKRLRAARIDQLADSNEPAITTNSLLGTEIFFLFLEISTGKEWTTAFQLQVLKQDSAYVECVTILSNCWLVRVS